MSRLLPPTLTAALLSPVRRPALAVTAADVFDRPWSSATGGAAGRSSLIRLASGSYLRAYVTQPGMSVDASVYVQLLTDLTDASQLAAWSLRASHAAMQAGVCLTVFGSTLFLFYQRRSDRAVCYQTSPDGVTWTAESVASSPGVTVWALASAGAGDLFQAQDAVSGDDTTQSIVLLTYSAGTFTTASAWTNPNGRVTGLTAQFDGAAFRLALGAQSRPDGGQALCALSYASGAWSALTALHPIDDPDTGLSLPYPSLVLGADGFRCASVLYDSGAASGAPSQRAELWTSPDFVHWRLEQTVAGPFANGCSIATGPSAGWVLADAGVVLLSTQAAGAGLPAFDLSPSLLRLEIDEPAAEVATAAMLLDNHDGRFDPAATTAVRVGAAVTVALGYGGDLVTTHALWIDRLQAVNAEVSGVEVAALRLDLSNRMRRLDRQVPVERAFQGATLLFLAAEVVIAGGIPAAPVSPPTAQFSETVDAFRLATGPSPDPATQIAGLAQPSMSGIGLLPPAYSPPRPSTTNHLPTSDYRRPAPAPSSFRHAFDRLRALFGFDWFLDETETLQLREPSPGDPVDFSYGSGGVQTIGHAVGPVRRPNHIRVTAPAAAGVCFADAVDLDAQASVGELVSRTVSDRLLGSSAQAQIRAALELRRAQRDGIQGSARLPLNPAHQPLDVISIADESLAATLRIERIRWLVDLQAGIFEQEVDLRAP